MRRLILLYVRGWLILYSVRGSCILYYTLCVVRVYSFYTLCVVRVCAGAISISCDKTVDQAGYSVSDLVLRKTVKTVNPNQKAHQGGSRSRGQEYQHTEEKRVKHYWFTAWPVKR